MASRSELWLHTGCFYESVSKMLRPEPCCRLSPSDPLKVDIILNNISTLSRRFWCHTRVENCQRFRSWWKGKERAPNFCWQWGGFSSTCLCGCRKDDASIQLFGSFIRQRGPESIRRVSLTNPEASSALPRLPAAQTFPIFI